MSACDACRPPGSHGAAIVGYLGGALSLPWDLAKCLGLDTKFGGQTLSLILTPERTLSIAPATSDDGATARTHTTRDLRTGLAAPLPPDIAAAMGLKNGCRVLLFLGCGELWAVHAEDAYARILRSDRPAEVRA